MRLRRPCEHDLYDPHVVDTFPLYFINDPTSCPGGEFLPEDAEQVDMLIQALGDILVASGIRAVPMTGPEVLAHAETLRLWIIEQRTPPCEHGFIVSHLLGGPPGLGVGCSGKGLAASQVGEPET